MFFVVGYDGSSGDGGGVCGDQMCLGASGFEIGNLSKESIKHVSRESGPYSETLCSLSLSVTASVFKGHRDCHYDSHESFLVHNAEMLSICHQNNKKTPLKIPVNSSRAF